MLADLELLKQEVSTLNSLKKETANLTRPVLPINEEFAKKNSKHLKKERSILKLEKRIFSKRIETIN
jgi:hypothetical protein